MNEIVLYSICIVTVAVELLKYLNIIPLKYSKHVLSAQFVLCLAYCIFLYDTLSNFRLYLVAAPFIAYITYLASLLIVGTNFNRENLLLKKVQFEPAIKKQKNVEIIRNFYTSTVEEVVYRAIFQYTLYVIIGNAYIPALIVIAVFTAAHYRKGIAIVQMLDILFFAVVIGVVFAVTENVVFTIIIHIIRNFCVIVQKYIVKQNKRNRFSHLMGLNQKNKNTQTEGKNV